MIIQDLDVEIEKTKVQMLCFETPTCPILPFLEGADDIMVECRGREAPIEVLTEEQGQNADLLHLVYLKAA